MSETDTAVPPALTREEWEVAKLYLMLQSTASSACGANPPTEEMHQRIALANALLPDGHPGKITRADAVFLRAFAEQYADEWRDGEWGGETAHLRQIVAKLEALLPPE